MLNSMKNIITVNWRTVAIAASASTASVSAICLYNQVSFLPFTYAAPANFFQSNRSFFHGGICQCKPITLEVCDQDTIDATDPTTYYYEEFPTWPARNLNKDHAVSGLMKPGFIERFKAYHRRRNGSNDASKFNDSEVLLASIKIGSSLNGHDGIVHGGVISLLLDETYGLGYEAFVTNNKDDSIDEFPMIVTANLNIDYKAPVQSNSSIVIRIFHTRTEGRKVYMHAKIESPDRRILYAEGTALFIKIRPEHLLRRNKLESV